MKQTLPADAPSIVLLGAGKMGFALAQGWRARGLAGARTTVIDAAPTPRLAAWCAENGLRLNPPDAGIAPPDVLVLAVKPQTLDEAAARIARLAGPETLTISILAGKSVADLAARAPQARAIVRAMPNTPAAIGRGVTGAFANAGVSARQRELADALLSAVGQVVWLDDEGLIDAVTAVSGSGPAYVFLLAECMAEAGRAAGLPDDVAMKLARATVEGSGELMRQSAETSPAQLRTDVTSPGGTTAAALAVLMADDGMRPLMTRAVAAAARRGRELAG